MIAGVHTSLVTLWNSDTLNPYPPSTAYESVNWLDIGSGNGLSPARYQAITWTKAELLSIRHWALG